MRRGAAAAGKRDRCHFTPLLSGDRLNYITRQSGNVVLPARLRQTE